MAKKSQGKLEGGELDELEEEPPLNSIMAASRIASDGFAKSLAEYRTLIKRAESPEPGDSQRLFTLLGELGLSIGDAQADADALASVSRAARQMVPAESLKEVYQRCMKAAAELRQQYRKHFHDLIDRFLDQDNLATTQVTHCFSTVWSETGFKDIDRNVYLGVAEKLLQDIITSMEPWRRESDRNESLRKSIETTKSTHGRIFTE